MQMIFGKISSNIMTTGEEGELQEERLYLE